MNILSVKRETVFYVETDEADFWREYVRDENGVWRYLRSYVVVNAHRQGLLEEAYIDYVERTFNGCH